MIARKRTLAAIRERETSKEIMYEQRIPLGRKVYHSWAKNDGDDIFFGEKMFFYSDGSVHLHIELVCETGDGYEVDGNSNNVIDVVGYVGLDRGVLKSVDVPGSCFDSETVTTKDTTEVNTMAKSVAKLMEKSVAKSVDLVGKSIQVVVANAVTKKQKEKMAWIKLCETVKKLEKMSKKQTSPASIPTTYSGMVARPTRKKRHAKSQAGSVSSAPSL